MSPQPPLQLEGSSLEELLEQVRREHGPTAQIVKAEKVRRGGVGGFFARETFVIEVSLDPNAAPAAAPSAPSVPSAAPAPRSVLDLVDQRNAEEHDTLSGLSTQTDAFSTMLARLQREAMEPEDDFVMVRPPRVVATRPTVPAQRGPSTMPVDDEPDDVPMMRRAEDLYAAEPVGTDVEVEETAPPKRPVTRRRATDAPAKPRATRPAVERPSTRPTVDRPSTRPAKAVAVRADQDSVLPARVISGDGGLDPAQLMQWLRALPEAPVPTADGGAVIALVGPVEETYATATRLAADLGIDPGATTVVSRTADLPGATSLREAAAVATSRRRWVRQSTATIVVIDAPMTARRGAAWRDAVMDEVAPTFTYGVLPATTKPEDLDHWAARLGGVDALALYDVTETAQPATALQCGIPVGLLDGSTASPALWAGLLLDRMVAA